MKHLIRTAAAALLLGTLAPSASAQDDTATQDVTIVLEEISQIDVTGTVSLTIDTVTPGQAPSDATDDVSATYSVTTNGTTKRITGSINEAYPDGISLSVLLVAPTASGTSTGTQALGTNDVDLVTGVSQVAQQNMGITYTASATDSAAPTAGATRTVTYTILE
jgi:hypothetical protein